MTKQILVCGDNQTLVETRRAILRKEGYEVTACDAETATDRIVGAIDIDLFVLCSSLSRDQQLSLLEQFHNQRPGKKSLIVFAGSSDDRLSSSSDFPFPAFNGPVQFLKQVNTLLIP